MDVSMSLDDIIKKKKIGQKKKPTAMAKRPVNVQVRPTGGAVKKFIAKPATSAKPIQDARNKIIQKNRAKIRDARDKLAQIARRGDARLKLLKKKKQYSVPVASAKRVPVSSLPPKRAPVASKQLYMRDMSMDVDMDIAYAAPVSLRRTVKNEIAFDAKRSMPPLPTFKYMDPPKRNESAWESDPFDCYEVPVARPYDVSEPRHLNRSIHTSAHMDTVPAKGILRSTSNSVPPMATYSRAPIVDPYAARSISRYASIDENSHLSQEMRNRLQRAPDTTQSVGLFSNPYSSSAREVSKYPTSNPGYRIVVSNLHNSVSQSDIKELFEDIGELIDARLVRSGVAEVVFEKLKDAEAAVETYHNRQLDGQPMKCMLVNPRASNKPTAPAIRSSHSTSGKSSKVEIDIDALHSVLFRRN